MQLYFSTSLQLKKMKVYEQVRERTQEQATIVMVFLKYMMDQDDNNSHFDDCGIYAVEIATALGNLLGVDKNAVYNAY